MLIQFFARPGRLAEEDGDDYKAQIHRMDADGTKSSLAKMMYDILRNPKRQFRYKEHKQKVKARRYHLRLVEAASTHNVKMKAVGFEKKKGRYGIRSHYCFTGDPILGLKIASRHF
jgi:hypothetical protein